MHGELFLASAGAQYNSEWRKNSRLLAKVLISPDKIKELRDPRKGKIETAKRPPTRKMTQKKQTEKRKLKESDTDSKSSVNLQH